MRMRREDRRIALAARQVRLTEIEHRQSLIALADAVEAERQSIRSEMRAAQLHQEYEQRAKPAVGVELADLAKFTARLGELSEQAMSSSTVAREKARAAQSKMLLGKQRLERLQERESGLRKAAALKAKREDRSAPGVARDLLKTKGQSGRNDP